MSLGVFGFLRSMAILNCPFGVKENYKYFKDNCRNIWKIQISVLYLYQQKQITMKFVQNLTNDLAVKTVVKETEKAVLVNATRFISATNFDKDFNKVKGFKLFDDQIWIPKSAIQNNTVAEWFAKKESITILN